MKKRYLAVAATLASGLFTQHSAHAVVPLDPARDYVECYVDAGPHAYEPNSCYAFVRSGPQTANAYFIPSTPVLVLLGSEISPAWNWSAAQCRNTPAFMPCVVPIGNHQEKTVTFNIPSYGWSLSAMAGYDEGFIP